MITNGKRLELARQSQDSLCGNAKNHDSYNMIIVCDGWAPEGRPTDWITYISAPPYSGASRCRNIGASSIPRYRRGQYVMFVDDDVYMCPGWDEILIKVSKGLNGQAIVS